ncbi:syntaxin [Holotrichia oblita]|uniref:Syntaxin n=2 Tax=Holotrichia oblita TaxID=644536 RepID=A0ACB9T7B0_HOLOL|nr:syntaxin [Holotrichia oblita]KAI4462686.1 syntaxin [Holotrichia oblita]
MSRKSTVNYGTMETTSDVQFAGTSSNEFNSLCDNIVTNIYTINTSWKTLDSALKAIGTPRDNKGLRDNIHVTQLSANQLVPVTTSYLQKLNRIVKKGEKQQKLQVEKLTDNFKEALANYSSLQKQLADKMKANLLMSPIEYEQMTEDPEYQKQAQLSRELAFEKEMLLDRELSIKKIEADILDVNEIMRELSTIVHNQEELVDSIENNIDATATHVEDGTSELQKAAQYQRKYRKRLCLLALIGTVVLIILIIVLVVELRR